MVSAMSLFVLGVTCMDVKNIILHLSLIEQIGPVFIKKLVEIIGVHNLGDLYGFTEQDFVRFGTTAQKGRLLVAGLRNRDILTLELDAIRKIGNVEWVTLWCEQYPLRLKHIDVPPVVLYLQGNISLLSQTKMLACVGARLSNSYAQDCLNRIVLPLILDDWIIVSGGALGADTFAHKAAIDNGGKTIVVVGSGLCHQYPPANKQLFTKIVNLGGLIVSSFSMETEPKSYCFPIRNRIVSGLSVGCLVLQAAVKSGALITAQCALDQGREVFAIPGPLYDPLSAGCHELIKLGAKLVTETKDILDELPAGFHSKNDAQEACIVTKESIAECVYADEQERLILQYTTVATSTDELAKKIGIPVQELQGKLFMLSLDGKIKQDFMGYWTRFL